MDNKQTTISVVIPNYNYGHYLPRCLSSVISQTTLPDEIIVIDDGSTDGSIEYLNEMVAKYPFIKLYQHTENIGLMRTLPECLHLPTSEYILVLASDDWLLPEIIHKSKKLLEQYPGVGLCSGLSLEYIEAKSLLRFHTSPQPLDKSGYISKLYAEKCLHKYDSWLMGNTVVFNRQLAIDLGGFRPNLKSLTDGFLFRLLVLKFGACFIPEPMGVWRIHNKNYSNQVARKDNQMHDIIASLEKINREECHGAFSDSLMKRWRARLDYMSLSARIHSSGSKLKTFKLLVILIRYRYFDLAEVFNRKIAYMIKSMRKQDCYSNLP